MRFRKKEQVRKMNQGESIHQMFLKYGTFIADAALKTWQLGGRKRLRAFIKRHDFKVKIV